MSAAIYGAVALILVSALCYSAPARSLKGFAGLRTSLLGVSFAGYIAACIWPHTVFFVDVASFCASFAAIAFLSLLMAHIWGSKSAARENLIALVAYPALVGFVAAAAYFVDGWASAVSACGAGVTLVACVYARSAVKNHRRSQTKSRPVR